MSGYAGRDSDGRHTSSPSDDDLLSCFETGRPFRTTVEVAERFDVAESAAARRLTRLADESRLRRVALDGQTVVWWQDDRATDRPDDRPAAAHSGVSDLLSYFETGRPFRTTEEVADRFDVDPSTAHRHLRRSLDVSWVESHTLGDTTVWWRDRETVGTTQPDNDPLFDAPAFDADEPVDEPAVDATLYGETNS